MKLAEASLCVIKQKPHRHEESCYIELSRVVANSVHYRPWHYAFYAVIFTPLLYPWERDVGANWIVSWVGPRNILDGVQKRIIHCLCQQSNYDSPFSKLQSSSHTKCAVRWLKYQINFKRSTAICNTDIFLTDVNSVLFNLTTQPVSAAGHSLSNSEVINEWSCTSTPRYAFALIIVLEIRIARHHCTR